MRNRTNIWLLLSLLIVTTAAAGFGLKYFYKAAYPLDYKEYIEEFSVKYNIDKELAYAVIHTESGFNKDAVSKKNARGLMQITEETFNWAKLRMGDKRDISYADIFNDKINIQYGIYILHLLYQEFNTTDNVLAAYHAGWGSVTKWLAKAEDSKEGMDIIPMDFPETREYLRRVNRAVNMYKSLYKP